MNWRCLVHPLRFCAESPRIPKRLYTAARCFEKSNVPNLRSNIVAACVLLGLGIARVAVADAPVGASTYSVKTWENDDGLPQNSVLSMVQTHDGYLWLGTFNGLVRFNGTEFRNLTSELTDRIVHLFEDSRGTL